MPADPTAPAALVERDGGLMIITFNRPGAMNAVNGELSTIVGEALETAEHDVDVRAVVLTGAGDRAFCAGADLKAVSRGESVMPDGHPEWGFAGYVRHPISKPTIAAVNGFALGGGTEIALASDLVVSLESARFGLPEVTRGIYAGAGGVLRLPVQVPRKVAMKMIFTGEPISAGEAQRWGLINDVVEDDVLGAAKTLARKIAANAPLAVQASKRIALGLRDGVIDAEVSAWALSESEGQQLTHSEDAKEGPLAFAEKRAPVWTGR